MLRKTISYLDGPVVAAFPLVRASAHDHSLRKEQRR
jgi:hypothetical protein